MKIFNKYYIAQALKKNTAFSARIQSILQFFGIAIHNFYRDECCVDFQCCNKYKDNNKNNCWLHISKNDIPIVRNVWYEPTAPVGEPNRTFIKKTKWVLNQTYKIRL